MNVRRRLKEAAPYGEVVTTEPPPPPFSGSGQDLNYYRHTGSTPLEIWHVNNRANNTTGGFQYEVDKLYGMLFHTSRTIALDRIGITISAAAVAGTNARIGVYECVSDTNIYPGDLLFDAGEVDVASTGDKDITISQSLSGPGIYFFAVIFEAIGALRGHAIGNASQFVGIYKSGSAWVPLYGYMHDQAYGALPSTFPDSAPERATDAIAGAASAPAVRVRLSGAS